MNNIKFYVNMNDDVVRCEYSEKIDDFKYELITLPRKELYNILSSFLKKYNTSLSEEQKNDINILTFSDVDVFEMDEIIKRNRKYKLEENKNRNIYTEPSEYNIPKKNTTKKVVRKNKFKKVFVRTSATLLSTLVMYAAVKEVSDNINFNDIPLSNGVTYNDNLFMDFKNHDNVFPIENFQFEEETIQQNINVSEISNVDSIEDENKENNLIVDETTNQQEEKENLIIEETLNTESTIDEDNLITDLSMNEQEIIPDIVFSLNADDWTNTDKYFVANAYYRDAITKTALTYGIDPQLALAIGIHERGLHSEYVDAGGAIGLFQIQVEGGWNWENKQITAYNFDTNSYETVTITKDSVSDVFQNIKVGCMMIQDILVRNNYNVLKSVTEYNYGSENLRYVLERCSNDTGYRTDELNSMNNQEWLNYRNVIHGGDPNYLENVFKYIPNGSVLTFTKPSGEVLNIQYNNGNTLTYNV